MGLVSGELFATGSEHGERRLRSLVESLAIDESIRARADLGDDLGPHIGVGRLDLFDFLLRRPVLGRQQQVQRLDHRRLADLIGAADHHHSVVGELELAVGDAAVVGQDQPMQFHAMPLSTSLNSSDSAALASSASSPSERATATSSSTAAAAKPPIPRSSNSPSAGITAISD